MNKRSARPDTALPALKAPQGFLLLISKIIKRFQDCDHDRNGQNALFIQQLFHDVTLTHEVPAGDL